MCVICWVMHYIYINSRDLLRQLCQRWRNTHRGLCTQAERPMDISWLLHKLPTPRGIYIPRLLSIIRHLSFFFSLHYQTPCSDCKKILISVLMPWQRAIETEIQGGAGGGEGERQRDGQKKVHQNTKMCFCPRGLTATAGTGTAGRTDRQLSWHQVCFPHTWRCQRMRVSPCRDKAGGQIWCVSTPPESRFIHRACVCLTCHICCWGEVIVVTGERKKQ